MRGVSVPVRQGLVGGVTEEAMTDAVLKAKPRVGWAKALRKAVSGGRLYPREGSRKGRRVKACPCCGNENLYLGHQTCDAMAVICWGYGGGCGLRMVAHFPDRSRAGSLKRLEEKVLDEAVKRWNRRAG